MTTYEARADTVLDLLDQAGLGSHRATEIVVDALREAVREALMVPEDEASRWWRGALNIASKVKTTEFARFGTEVSAEEHDRLAAVAFLLLLRQRAGVES